MTPPPIQVEVSNTSVAWTLELVTPWSACGPAQAHPLIDAEVVAKVRVQTSVLTGAACLSGGVDVSVGGGAAALLPWDATAAAATTTPLKNSHNMLDTSDSTAVGRRSIEAWRRLAILRGQ